MSEGALWRRWLLAVLFEACFWGALTSGFLYIYIARYGEPFVAVRPHFAVIATLVFGLFCIRLAAWRITSGIWGGRLLSAALAAALLALLLSYYGLVLVGLESWGHVVSWRLIRAYSTQSAAMLDALGIGVAWALLAFCCFVVTLWLTLLLTLLRHDAASMARDMSRGLIWVVAIAGLLFVAIRIYDFSSTPAAAQREPVSLTFFPEQSRRRLQDHHLNDGKAVQAADDAARLRYVPNPNALRRNVILIVGDALRADHLSVMGYARATTPYLQSLARSGNLLISPPMVSACVETTCGLLAISQSRYVNQLSEKPFNLQEVLRRHGYAIRMILGGDHTNFYGLRASYGALDSYFDATNAGRYYMNDDQLVVDHVASLEPWDGKPVMLQLHLMSSHALGRRHADSQKFEPATNYSIYTAAQEFMRPSGPRADITNYYDNGIVQFDSTVQTVLESLRSKGYLSNAVIAITGDHGDVLGEHGEFGHAKTVYQAALRIPFLLMRSGYDSSQPLLPRPLVSQIDIGPTLLEELQMPEPPNWKGEALQKQTTRRFVFFEQAAQAGLFDLIDPDHVLKYWNDTQKAKEYVYDVSNDGGEEINLLSEVEAARLREWRRAVLPSLAAQ